METKFKIEKEDVAKYIKSQSNKSNIKNKSADRLLQSTNNVVICQSMYHVLEKNTDGEYEMKNLKSEYERSNKDINTFITIKFENALSPDLKKFLDEKNILKKWVEYTQEQFKTYI